MANNSIYLNGQLSSDAHLVGKLSEPLQVLYGTLLNPEVLRGSLSNATLRGYSAYDLAVLGGYEGTIEEWLASLKAQKLEIRNNDGVLEYKYENEHMWTILIDLSSYTDDYEKLRNRPSLDGQVLSGNRDLTNKYLMTDRALTNLEIDALLGIY